MKHLVISVSPDSSLDLLERFADVIILDKGNLPSITQSYDTFYIRSHFSHPQTLPQNFSTEITQLAQDAKRSNPGIIFIDGMDTVDKIVAFEDKWLQYQTFSEFMPRTQLASDMGTTNLQRPIFKNRLSSRGKGVTWDVQKIIGPAKSWIVQESLDIAEELRVYVIRGKVYPIGAIRRSMNAIQTTQAISSRALAQDEIEFALKVSKQALFLDMVGLDIARTLDGRLSLMEVNRSPGFGKFAELTGLNLAGVLYRKQF